MGSVIGFPYSLVVDLSVLHDCDRHKDSIGSQRASPHDGVTRRSWGVFLVGKYSILYKLCTYSNGRLDSQRTTPRAFPVLLLCVLLVVGA